MSSTRNTAVVTGGARGIGAAIALQLASEGNAVAVVDLDEGACASTVERIRSGGGFAQAVVADVTEEPAVVAAVEEICATLGPPTILVNNAGILRDNLMFKMTTADWDQVMQVHLRGAFLMTRAVQQHMVTAGYGRIVNMSSASARGNRGQVNYAAAKAALQGFTKTLALELGRFGITANAVAPGFIETEMTHATAERIGRPFAELAVEASQVIPVGRIGQPEDVANVVSFLASERTGFVTGQVIYVTGG